MKLFKILAVLGLLFSPTPVLAQNNQGLLPTKPSIAALKLLGQASSQYPDVLVTGYYTDGDGFLSQFHWNPASTATTTVCGPFAATGVTTGRWVSQSPISFRGCGAKGDGATDDTAAVQAAFNIPGKINVEPGNFFITSTIVPVSGIDVSGTSGSTISYDFSGVTHVGCAISNGGGAAVSDISIRNITFQNTTAAASVQYLPICLYQANNIWIEHNITIATGLGLVDSTGANGYDDTTDANSSHNVHVNYNNIGNGTTSNTIARSGFLFSYTRKWEAIGNAVSGTVFGIYWSGGDANANGAIGNERKNYNGSVVGNYVHDTSAGAIWGSMGQNISVTGNTVINGGDVGLDDEGGLNNTWTGNTCSEMANGCLTTFYLPVNVTFSENTVSQSTSSHPLIRTYNSFITGLSSVKFDGNELNYTGTGFGSVDDANGPVGTLTFTNNHLKNTIINFSSTNEHITTIRGNSVTFTQNAGTAINAINGSSNNAQGSASGILTIESNVIQSQVAQTAGSYGILTQQSDTGADPLVFIKNNSVVGFPNDMRWIWTGSGSSVTARGTISNNIFGAGTFSRSEGGTLNSVVHLINNTRPDGTPFPSTTDIGSSYWNSGQQFLVSAPAASGFIGKVETTDGAPGTQKDFGAIVP